MACRLIAFFQVASARRPTVCSYHAHDTNGSRDRQLGRPQKATVVVSRDSSRVRVTLNSKASVVLTHDTAFNSADLSHNTERCAQEGVG